MGIMSREIGVDLGTSNIRIFVKGKGIVVNEPSVIAINKVTGEVLAVGKMAKEMIGRTPDNIIAIRPLKRGVIADFDATSLLLEKLISRVFPKSFFRKPRLVISIPYEITDVEERAVEGVAYRAGAKDIYLVEEIMAASIGASLNVAKPEGTMVVNIGGGTTEMAVMSLGGIVVAGSIKIGGENLDKDIVDYVKNKHNCIISESDAEMVKIQIASAYDTMTEETISIKARNIGTGLPETLKITTKQVQEAILDTLDRMLKAIKKTLEQTPPELSADIMENGIIITGGVANVKNLDRYLSEELGIPVHIASNASDVVITGIGATLENIEMLKKASKTKK